MNKSVKIIVLTISAIIAVCLSILYIPSVQRAIVELVERIKDDDIRDIFWKQQMFAFATCGILLICLINYILWTKRGRNLIENFCLSIKTEYNFITKNNKYLLFFVAIYFLGYFTIIRGNYSYISVDDLERQLNGTRAWFGWYRYISEFGSIIIHTTPRLIDIAPLTQFFAIMFISLASFATVQVATDEKITWLSCVAALPIGLFPYFLATISYRYDSPYMALSVFASALPFVFRKDKIKYIIMSIVGLLAMCWTYQASNGIYIILTIFCALKMIKEEAHWQQIGKFILTSICCYVLTLSFFSFTFMEQMENIGPGQIDDSIKLSSIINNATKYIVTTWQGLRGTVLRVILTLIIVANAFLAPILHQKKKGIFFLASISFYILSLPLSYGAYLAMAAPSLDARAMYGIGFLTAVSSILLSCNLRNFPKPLTSFSKFLIYATSYCCLAFAFAFGNAQTEQNKYAEFRERMVIEDLSKTIPDFNDNPEIAIEFANGVDYAPIVQNLIKVYPLASICIDKYAVTARCNRYIMQSYGYPAKGKSSDCKDLPTLIETNFHIIQGKDNHYLVTFKEPQHKTIKTRGFVD